MPRRVADPAVMRALAHPLRLAILAEMWDTDRPLRATDLAEILGEPANSISYHIRRLRDAGYVLDSEGPEGATARDHWYVSPQRGITGDDDATDADGLREAFGAVLRTRYSQVAEHVIDAQAAQEKPLVHVDDMIWLPQDLARAYVRRLADLADEMRRAAAAARTSAEPGTPFTRYTVTVDLVPQVRRGERLELPVERTPVRTDRDNQPDAS